MKKANLFRLILMMVVLLAAQLTMAQTGQYCIGGPGNETATNVKVLPDGTGSIISGYRYDIDSVTNQVINANMLLMKVNPSGTSIIWQKEFGIAGSNNLVQNMIITHDGDIVVVGTVGRNSVFGANVAAIMKFRSLDGAMLWQNCMRDAAHTTGGEVFYGVTELGAAGNFDLVAVGAHDSRPYFNSSMVCVFQSNGTLRYEEDRRTPWAGTYSSNNYYGICTAANGVDVYTAGIFRDNYADVRIDMYHPNTTATSGTVLWSRSFNYSLPGVVLLNDPVPGALNLQNNYVVNIYLAGDSLLIHGGSLNNFTFTGGSGESIMRMHANGTGTAELWQIQNSGVNYANTSKIAVIDADHIVNVQMPHTSWIDPIIWLAGTATNSVVTDVTSLYGNGINSTINTPIRYTTPTGGIHAMFDIDLNAAKSRMELAGSTTDGANFGANDIYFIKAPVAQPQYECNKDDRGGTVTVSMNPLTPTYILETRTMESVSVNVVPSSYKIKALCEQKVPCYDSTDLTYVSAMDSMGNCIFTVTASVSTTHTIVGYEWTLPGGIIMITTSASSNSQTFVLPPGLGFHVSVRVLIVRTTWPEGESPCCEVTLDKELSCREQPVGCFDEPATNLSAISFPGAPGPLGPDCHFNLTMTAVPLPGWAIVGYEWRIAGAPGSIVSSNTMMIVLGSGTGNWVEVVVYAVNANGDTCTTTRIITLDCLNGVGSSYRPAGGSKPKGDAENSSSSIDVYPNPTDGMVTISSTNTAIDQVQVMDMNGKVLVDNTYKNVKSAHVSLSKYAAGTYLIRVNGNNSKVVVKSE